MIEWFASHNGIEQMFLLSGIVGGVIILFQLILMIVGLDHHGTDVHVDSDAGFQALTIQGISSFFAMFGIVGYALYHGALLGAAVAIIGAVAAGSFSMWLIQKIFRSMMKLQTSGTVSLYAAVGSEGSVYLTVGKDGGRVQINFANRLREFDAVSADGSTIPTGTPIRVQSVSANTLVVAPAER
ncbi:MAG TPA: NfeD family protein [Steroidobacteraceae bacterium]|nr:NfeD family protein [Steroidobacteraceae bacterium]